MGRPSKSVNVLKFEGKSHRTKKELDQREKQESALLTGVKLKEKDFVKNNPIAHAEFLRIKRLLGNIGKNDALQENIINRYCLMYAESQAMAKRLESLDAMMDALDDVNRDDADPLAIISAKIDVAKQISATERQIQQHRDMMLKIERESLMTTASAIRAVPKQTPKAEDPNASMFG